MLHVTELVMQCSMDDAQMRERLFAQWTKTDLIARTTEAHAGTELQVYLPAYNIPVLFLADLQ